RHMRPEQAELEIRLIRMLHRQPAIVAVSGVRMDTKAELFDIELQRLVLIVNIQAGYLDTLAHKTSLWVRPLLPPHFRRRFSETAILRSGRWAALTKQWGTRSRSCGTARNRLRNAPGLSPITSRKVRPKVPRLFQPV